jgi:hypothetical protein
MQLLQSRTQELLLGSKKGEGMQVESLVRWPVAPASTMLSRWHDSQQQHDQQACDLDYAPMLTLCCLAEA